MSSPTHEAGSSSLEAKIRAEAEHRRSQPAAKSPVQQRLAKEKGLFFEEIDSPSPPKRGSPSGLRSPDTGLRSPDTGLRSPDTGSAASKSPGPSDAELKARQERAKANLEQQREQAISQSSGIKSPSENRARAEMRAKKNKELEDEAREELRAKSSPQKTTGAANSTVSPPARSPSGSPEIGKRYRKTVDTPEKRDAVRQGLLRDVHTKMDQDNSGYIEPKELLLLGQARRKLGHKAGEWTEEKNKALVTKMDTDGDGKITADEFVQHFHRALPKDEDQFKAVISQFMDVAAECQRRSRRSVSAERKKSPILKYSSEAGHVCSLSYHPQTPDNKDREMEERAAKAKIDSQQRREREEREFLLSGKKLSPPPTRSEWRKAKSPSFASP